MGTGLSKQVIDILFDGLDTKSDAKLVARTKLLTCSNGVYRKGLAPAPPSIQKRNGYASLSQNILAGGTISAGDRLAQFLNELLLFSGGTLYSYDSVPMGWTSKGAVPQVQCINDQLIRNNYKQSFAAAGTVGGITCYVWQDSRNGVRATVVDEATGAQIQSDVSLNSAAGAVAPKCIALNGFLLIVYANGANIISRTLKPATPYSFGAEVTLASDGNATPEFDVAPHGTIGLLAYNTSTATTFKIAYIHSDGTIGSAAKGEADPVAIAEDASKALTIAADTSLNNVWVVWANASVGTRASVRNPDLTALLAPLTLDAGLSTVNVTITFDSLLKGRIFYETTAGATYNHLVTSRTLTTAGTIGGAVVLFRSVGLASKAFQFNGNGYVIVIQQSTLQTTAFLVRQDGLLCAKMLYGIAGALQAAYLPDVPSPSTNVFIWPALQQTKIVTQANTVFTLQGVSKETITFAPLYQYQTAKLGQTLMIAGGIPGLYDGNSVTEYGFPLFPENVTDVQSGSGGVRGSGTWQYIVVYRWMDNQGQIHRSAPSIALSSVFASGTTNQDTLTIPTLRVTNKTSKITGIPARAEVQIEVYRTVSLGTTFYEITSETAPLMNDPTVDSVSFVDNTITDAALISNQILYTTGGVFGNIAPPGFLAVTASKNRLFGIDPENRLRIWGSEAYVLTDGVAFSDSFTIQVDPFGGDATTLGYMDDKLVIFKRASIFVVGGDGPNNDGSQNTWTTPFLVSTDVGCTQPLSIVLTPVGLLFKSAKGFYLLTRDLQVVYKGAPVEAYNGNTVSSAVLVDQYNEVRITHSDGDAVVWNYYFDQWSTFANYTSTGGLVWFGGGTPAPYLFATSAGLVNQEITTLFTDNGVQIPLLLETSWIKLNGFQGFSRVWRASVLGTYFSAHNLRMLVAYDYQPYDFEEHDFQPAGATVGTGIYGQHGVYGTNSPYGGTLGVTGDGVYQFRAGLVRQRCEAVKFKIQDTGSSTGQAYSLTALSLEAGFIPGLLRLPAAKSV